MLATTTNDMLPALKARATTAIFSQRRWTPTNPIGPLLAHKKSLAFLLMAIGTAYYTRRSTLGILARHGLVLARHLSGLYSHEFQRSSDEGSLLHEGVIPNPLESVAGQRSHDASRRYLVKAILAVTHLLKMSKNSLISVSIRILMSFHRWVGQAVHNPDRLIISNIIENMSSKNPSSDKARKNAGKASFNGAAFDKSNSFNAHKRAANNRLAAEQMIARYAKSLRSTVWSYSKARRDYEGGDRVFYNHKDTRQTPQIDARHPKQVVQLTDVDFYLEENDLANLVVDFSPICLYTFQVTRLVHRSEDSETTMLFYGDNLTYLVRGGGTFNHKVWDWNRDFVVLNCNDFSIACDVVTHCIGGDRLVVFIVPLRVYPAQSRFLLDYLEPVSPLRRYTTESHNQGVELLRTRDGVSIGRIGEAISYELPLNAFYNLVVAAKEGSATISTVDRLSKLGTSNHHLRHLLKCIDLNISPHDTNWCRPIPVYEAVYSDIPPGDLKFVGQEVTMPIIGGLAALAGRTLSNSQCTVERRIVAQRNDVQVPKHFENYIKEFVDLLVQHTGILTPYTEEDVLDRSAQNKRALYQKAFDEGLIRDDRPAKAFQKTECYPDFKAPRNISNADKQHVVQYLRYVLPLSQALKDSVTWYAFGLSPHEIVQAVVDVASDHSFIVETDFSNYDGTISQFLRQVEMEVFCATFGRSDELVRLIGESMDNTYKTDQGIYYQQLSSRASGSAETSCANTFINAFANYCCLREQNESIEGAWRLLGLYGGDDGLTFYPDPNKAETTMQQLGLKMKSNVRHQGMSVSFLARIYPNPWNYGGSCFDIRRAAKKLHYSTSNPANVPTELAAWRKAVSLFVTDSQTPLLSVWARRVLELVPNGTLEAQWQAVALDLPIGIKLVSEDIIDRYHNKPLYPPPERGDSDELLTALLGDAPVALEDVNKWITAVQQANSLSEFPAPIWCEELPQPDFAVATKDEYFGQNIPESAQDVCQRYLIGACRTKCKFHHPKDFCRNFVNGNCVRGSSCKFPHYSCSLRSKRTDKASPIRPEAQHRQQRRRSGGTEPTQGARPSVPSDSPSRQLPDGRAGLKPL